MEDLCGAPSCSEACLFFSDDFLHLWLQSVQYDLQHDFAWVTWRGMGSVRLYFARDSPCDEKKFVLSPDVILCGCLGSKHQLNKSPGKASWDRVALPNLRCMLDVLVFP